MLDIPLFNKKFQGVVCAFIMVGKGQAKHVEVKLTFLL